MFSLSIVIRFDVFEYFRFCCLPNGESLSVNESDFQRVKKTSHRSIVIAVCLAAHAATQAIFADQSLISF